MPLAAIGTGAVDPVLAVEHIAQEIVTCGSTDHTAPARSDQLLEATNALETIAALLQREPGRCEITSIVSGHA